MSTDNPIDVGTAAQSLVLVHGMCCMAGDFQWHIDRLAHSHRVLAPTLRGHDGGNYDANELTIELMAEDVARAITAKKINNTVICGHSLGVRVALAGC